MKFSKAEIDAVIAAPPRTTVAFNKLCVVAGLSGPTRRYHVGG